MTEHEEIVVLVLETRQRIVRSILYNNTCAPSDRPYYEGKAEGYGQAIDLLRGTDKSAAIELEEDQHK